MLQVDVKSPRCEGEGCELFAHYGYPGEAQLGRPNYKRLRRCSQHILPGMVRAALKKRDLEQHAGLMQTCVMSG